MKRRYIARYTYSYYGTYTCEIEFYSEHRANSKANMRDAKMEIIRSKEKGIALNSQVDETWLAKD